MGSPDFQTQHDIQPAWLRGPPGSRRELLPPRRFAILIRLLLAGVGRIKMNGSDRWEKYQGDMINMNDKWGIFMVSIRDKYMGP